VCYALISCDWISPNHIAAAKANGLEFLAICDIVSENMEDEALKFDLPHSVRR
jgi:predicted dehydrogenase